MSSPAGARPRNGLADVRWSEGVDTDGGDEGLARKDEGDKTRLRWWTDATASAKTREPAVNRDLRDFAAQWLRVAAMALVPVVLTAFMCVPMAIERHPGEAPLTNDRYQGHMT